MTRNGDRMGRPAQPSSAARLRCYEQGASIVVIGTDVVADAARALPSEVQRYGWNASYSGRYARRQGLWRLVSDLRPLKDARPGVQFTGVRRGPCPGCRSPHDQERP